MEQKHPIKSAKLALKRFFAATKPGKLFSGRQGESKHSSEKRSIKEDTEWVRRCAPGSLKVGDNLTWALENGTLTIRGEGEMWKFWMAPWYDQREEIQTVVLESGVTSIRSRAFYGCIRLTSIRISDSVSSIEETTFCECGSLREILVDVGNLNYISEDGILFSADKREIVCCPCKYSGTSYIIPDSVITIERYAFYGCSGLTSIAIPNGVATIREEAFRGCSGLTSLTIPNSVTTMYGGTFQDCSSLVSVTLPDNIPYIDEYTFRGCKSLISLTIPDKVTLVLDCAFFDCSALTSVTIPSSVVTLGDCLFYECSSLTSIELPDGVNSIGEYAFYGCKSLTSIRIPDHADFILNGAFRNCSNLASVTIPDRIRMIGAWAFQGCTGLKDVYYGGTEGSFASKTKIGDSNFELMNATWHFKDKGGEEI